MQEHTNIDFIENMILFEKTYVVLLCIDDYMLCLDIYVGRKSSSTRQKPMHDSHTAIVENCEEMRRDVMWKSTSAI